jgi:hypothetical protein
VGPHPPKLAFGALALLASLALGCGGGGGESPIAAKLQDQPDSLLGFPVLATKNTTRVAGEDSTQVAAAVALAVYPGRAFQRPEAVTLVDEVNWRAGIAAAALAAPPLGAPILVTSEGDVPDVSADALEILQPRGAPGVGRVQAFPIGEAATPEGIRSAPVKGRDPFALAADVDELRTRVTGRPSANVVVASAIDHRFAMPAAGWAAKSGDPVLFVTKDSLPAPTAEAIRRHERPRIYVLGPRNVISDGVARRLRRLGSVTRIAGRTPVESAIAFARFSDGAFGWGVQDPGHGLVIANSSRPLDAPAAAPLSSSGTYGPLLLVDSAERLPGPLENYLLDIQPGFESDPVRGVYNHAWLIGDESAVSAAVQDRIDQLTEIVPVRRATE